MLTLGYLSARKHTYTIAGVPVAHPTLAFISMALQILLSLLFNIN